MTCHCPTCDEKPMHCEHGINLEAADCATCDAVAAETAQEAADERRTWLMGYYESRAEALRLERENELWMGRTVKYFSDADVLEEYTELHKGGRP